MSVGWEDQQSDAWPRPASSVACGGREEWRGGREKSSEEGGRRIGLVVMLLERIALL